MASRTEKRKKAARTISRAMNKVAGRRAVNAEEFRAKLRKAMNKTIDEEFIDVTPEDRKRFRKQYTLVGLAGQVGQREARGGWHGPSGDWEKRGWKKLKGKRWKTPEGRTRTEEKGWTFVRETKPKRPGARGKDGKPGKLWRDPKGHFNTSANLKRSQHGKAHWRKIHMLADAAELPVSEIRKAWKELGPDAEEIIRAVAGGEYPEEKQGE